MKSKFPLTCLLLCTVFIFCVMSINVYGHDYAMSFLYGGTSEQYINCIQDASGVLDCVSPDYFEINPDGSLKIRKIDRKFISAMHKKNVQVVPFITNYWDRKLGQAALDNAEALTAEIARAIQEYDLDGINVDIENVNDKRKDDYTYFVASLRHKMPDKVLSVSVAANPNDWQTGWHGSYDYKRLADNSDYLLLMSYDESYYGSKPGPVASARFTEASIEYALTSVPPEKLVLGVPFFGRYWKQGEPLGGHGLTSMDVDNLLKNYTAAKTYFADTQSAQVMVTVTESDTQPKLWGGRELTPGVYEIWYDDIEATAYKLALVNRYGLKGAGSWALGQHSGGMWDAYAQYKAGTAAPAASPPDSNPPEKYPPDTSPSFVDGWEELYPTPAPAVEGMYIPQTNIPAAISGTPPTGTAAPQATRSRRSRIYRRAYISVPNALPNNTNPNDTGAPAGSSTQNAPAPQNTGPANATGAPVNNGTRPYKRYQTNSAASNVPSAQAGGTTRNYYSLQTSDTPGNTAQNTAGPQASGQVRGHFSTDPLSDNARFVISKGWMPEADFQEDRYVTHGDAVAVIMKMAALLPDSYNLDPFTDTAGHPQEAYIRKAREYGIVRAGRDGSFHPERVLSRQDLILYLDRVFNLPDTINFENNIAIDLQKENNAERYYAVQKYLAHGIVRADKDARFRPSDAVSMGEMAAIIRRMDGCGLRDLRPLQYTNQSQRKKILEPR